MPQGRLPRWPCCASCVMHLHELVYIHTGRFSKKSFPGKVLFYFRARLIKEKNFSPDSGDFYGFKPLFEAKNPESFQIAGFSVPAGSG